MKVCMKISFFIISSLSLFSTLTAQSFDKETDKEIYDCVSAANFSKTLVSYPYQGIKYPIAIVHNPAREFIWLDDWDNPIDPRLAVVADLPLPLSRHLENLLQDVLGSGESAPIDLNNMDDYLVDWKGYFNPKEFMGALPIYLATKIDDPENDRAIYECFRSTSFANQVFYYFLDKKAYQVRILVNPEKRPFTAQQKFNMMFESGFCCWRESTNVYTITWPHKYGIITDARAPQALIDHLSSLAEMSCWDWYMNFKIHNGTYVEYAESSYDVTTFYSLDTWFNFTKKIGANN